MATERTEALSFVEPAAADRGCTERKLQSAEVAFNCAFGEEEGRPGTPDQVCFPPWMTV